MPTRASKKFLHPLLPPISLVSWANASLAVCIGQMPHQLGSGLSHLPPASTYWLEVVSLSGRSFLENRNRSEKPPSFNSSLVTRGKPFLSGDNCFLPQASETWGHPAASSASWTTFPCWLLPHPGLHPGFHGE